MVTRFDNRKAFVRRLTQACDESKIIPPHGQGRQRMIAERVDVAQETVSKWFKAVAMPQPDPMQKLADLLEIDHSWLALGVQPEITPRERRVQGRQSDGAVHLAWGMLALEGAHCGAPAANDPRAEYVDFYATLRGSVYPIHVTLAREVSRDQFEIVLPREHNATRCLAVMPAGVGKYHFLDLVESLIKEHSKRKGAIALLTISRIDANKYQTGKDQWPRIKSFGELR